ncbi:MAG: hypothetical protein KDD38_11200, partial [Bdellovibrionales bacterium]|nr:hypothetical protein [Bdellovibrionales bacterium]
MHYLVVIACFFTISPTFASDIESVVLTNYAIKELDGLNSHHKKCSDENPPCSGLLSQYILDAKSDGGYFGTIKSNWNTCQREINRSHRFSTSTDLAKYLNEKSDTAIGPIHYDRITSCTSGNAEEDKSTTGTYFYLLNRMKMGANSSLEQIATIDSLLGDNEKNILEGLNCGSILLPQTTLRCEELKKCKSKVGALSQLASETAWAEKMISQAKQKISEITFRRGYRANDPRVKKINNIIRFYEMKYPWLQSETYNNHRKGKGQKLKDIQEAIKAQLINNRATLKDSYSQFRYGAACLGEMDREEAACSVDALKKLLEKAPTFSAVEFSNNNNEEVMESIAAKQFYDAACCVDNSSRDQDATA